MIFYFLWWKESRISFSFFHMRQCIYLPISHFIWQEAFLHMRINVTSHGSMAQAATQLSSSPKLPSYFLALQPQGRTRPAAAPLAHLPVHVENVDETKSLFCLTRDLRDSPPDEENITPQILNFDRFLQSWDLWILSRMDKALRDWRTWWNKSINTPLPEAMQSLWVEPRSPNWKSRARHD